MKSMLYWSVEHYFGKIWVFYSIVVTWD